MKREDYISWEAYFMEIAVLSSRRSKDPSKQVGCCIVDSKTKHILSIGYNGLPYGFDDNEFDWKKSKKLVKDKNSYVVHAEANAILNSNADLSGATVYVTLFPCNECAKLLAQKRVGKVVYLESDPKHQDRVDVSTAILQAAGIEIQSYDELIRKEKDDEE